MAIFVVDASAALAWCFEDEANSWTDGLLERLRGGDRIVVPAQWPTEILNGLLVASRRKRIGADQPALFWDELRAYRSRRSQHLTHLKRGQCWRSARSTVSRSTTLPTWN